MKRISAWLVVGVLALGGLLAPAQSGEAVIVMQDGLGDYLADSKERSLYFYTKDAENLSACYDQCAQTWPPFIVKAKPTAGKGFGVMDEFYDGGLLGTVVRKDGSLQATFNHRPLYYFSGDRMPGDHKGHAVDKVWFLASPKGEAVGKER